MIISHKYKFIFIKTYKTAGTSLEAYLSKVCADDDIVTPIYPSVFDHTPRHFSGRWNPAPEVFFNRSKLVRKTISDFVRSRKFYNHIPAQLVKYRLIGRQWDDYYKFCVERNPWDKTLSHYHMINSRSNGDVTLQKYLCGDNFSLNYQLYTDWKGDLLVDRVLRYETLTEDLTILFKELSIPFNGTLEANAKSDHRLDRRHYRDVFTMKQRFFVERLFEKEIQMHGYRY